MYSPRLLDHFENPRCVGELPPPARTVEASNPACGDTLRLSVRLDADRVVEARYKARGCTASIAAGSALMELIGGKSLRDMSAIQAADIEEALGGLAPESQHAAVLAVDAVKALVRSSAANQ